MTYRHKITGEVQPQITDAQYKLWADAIPRNIKADIYEPFTPEPEPTPPPAPRIQFTRTVLDRLTDTEYAALCDCPVIAIQHAMEAARIEQVISESDKDFPAFVAGCDALGIIAASRWDDLLAP